MIASLLALILIASVFVSADTTPYTGYRFSIKKEMLRKAYYGIYDTAAKSLIPEKWANVSQKIANGTFGAGFYMTNIVCTSGVFDASKVSDNSKVVVNGRDLTVSFDPAPLKFTFTFAYEYKLIGMSPYFGTGILSITPDVFGMVQTFNPDALTTKMGVTWRVTIDKISGGDLFKGVTRWISMLITDKLVPDFNTRYQMRVQAASDVNYGKWYKVITPLHDDKSVNMALVGKLNRFEENPAGYITFAFDTVVTVPENPYIKSLVKLQTAPHPIDPATNAQVCVAATLIPAMVEIRGKARSFVFPIEPKEIGLTGKLKDLFHSMSRLEEIFDANEVMDIGCRPFGDNDIVMLNDPSLPNDKGKIQVPINCVIGGLPSGKQVLSINFVVRAEVQKVVEQTNNVWTINGLAKTPLLYSFKIADSIVPVDQYDIIVRILDGVARKLVDFKLLPESLTLPIPFKAANLGTPELSKDEYCFNYA